jgi:hypothetical protein
MDVVRHEAVSEQTEVRASTPLAEEFDVGLVVSISEENRLAAVAPLRYVVRYTYRNHAGDAWHES